MSRKPRKKTLAEKARDIRKRQPTPPPYIVELLQGARAKLEDPDEREWLLRQFEYIEMLWYGNYESGDTSENEDLDNVLIDPLDPLSRTRGDDLSELRRWLGVDGPSHRRRTNHQVTKEIRRSIERESRGTFPGADVGKTEDAARRDKRVWQDLVDRFFRETKFDPERPDE